MRGNLCGSFPFPSMQGFLSKSACVGRVAGVQVRLSLLFALTILAALVALWNEPAATWWWATAFVTVLTVSLLIHELAHCLAARRHGGSPHQVVLWPLGGLVQISVPRSPSNEVAVALAGPLANLLLAAAGGMVLYSRGAPAAGDAAPAGWQIDLFTPPMDAEGLTALGIVRLATWVNLYLGCLNLLPAA